MAKDEKQLKNIDAENLDCGDIKLTIRERRFVFWYTYPGSDAFQIQTEAARRAGYKTPVVTGYELRRKEHIAKAIDYVLEKNLKVDLNEAFQKALLIKQARAFYDIGNFVKYSTKVIETQSGEKQEIEVEEFKDIKDLTPEQRMAVDSIDYKGPHETKILSFADRDKAMDDLIKAYEKLQKTGETNGDYDTELTYEIIKEQLSVKLSKREKKKELANKASFFDEGSELSEL